MDFENLPETGQSTEDCKGLVYRGYVNEFYFDGRYELKQGLRKLKKKSCPGCYHCGYLEDEMNEFISMDTRIIIPEIEHGELYTLTISNVSRDWESGIADDWDMEFIKIKEEK